jgi:CHAT domain-containing protein
MSTISPLRIFSSALLFLWLSHALADDIKLPPRTVDDIIKVLDKSAAYDQEFLEARKWAAETPPEQGSPEELNTFYITRSEAFAKLGQLENAKKDLLRVVNEYPSKVNMLRTQEMAMLGNYEGQTGNLNLALKYTFMARANTPARELGMLTGNNQNLVALYSEIGDFAEAEKYLRDGEATLVALKRVAMWGEFGRWWEAQTAATRGNYLLQQGRWTEAEFNLRKATQQMHAWMLDVEKLPINQPGADRTNDLGVTGKLLRNVVPRRLNAQITLAKALAMQGRSTEAEIQIREVLDLSLRHYGKNSLQVGTALLELSGIISEQNRLPEAELLAATSLKIFQAVGASEGSLSVVRARRYLARFLVAEHKYAQADKVFTEIQNALNSNQVGTQSVALHEVDWALAKLKIGQVEQALVMSEKLLAQAKSQSNPSEKRLASLSLLNALALQSNGQMVRAHEIYKKSTPVLLEALANDSESVSIGNREQDRLTSYLEGHIGLLASMHGQSAAGNSQRVLAEEAFTLADIARGSGVQKALTASAARANIKDATLAALAREEQDAQARINSLEHLLTGLLSAPPEQQLPSVQEKMKNDIAELKAHRNKLRKEIERKFPEYANLVNPKPASIAQVSKQLKNDEVLVSWYFADQEAFVWAITKQGPPQFHRIALGRTQMGQMVAKLRKALDPGVATIDDIPPFDIALAHQLYQLILAPVQSALADKRVMLSVPHAELGQLPLSLLVTKNTAIAVKNKSTDFSEYRQVPWLAKEMAVTQLPSVTALASLRNLPLPKTDRRAFIGFGDPFFSATQAQQADHLVNRVNNKTVAMRSVPLNLRSAPKTSEVSSAELALLPRLPDTKEEIQQIGKALSADPSQDIYLERDASVSKVMTTDLSNRQVVMFATHGLVPGELDGLTQPALALSTPAVTGESQGDGLLTMEKILTLKLDADWVVLSACNTASGEGAGSEAVSGLGRAFFYAGARALLVSNWPVDSEASRLLMTDLFRRQQATQGQHKAVYLRESMLDMIQNTSAKDSAGKVRYTYAHPLFWAPFVVVGD